MIDKILFFIINIPISIGILLFWTSILKFIFNLIKNKYDLMKEKGYLDEYNKTVQNNEKIQKMYKMATSKDYLQVGKKK